MTVDSGFVSLEKTQRLTEYPARSVQRCGFFIEGAGRGNARRQTESVPLRSAQRRLIAGPTPAVLLVPGQFHPIVN